MAFPMSAKDFPSLIFALPGIWKDSFVTLTPCALTTVCSLKRHTLPVKAAVFLSGRQCPKSEKFPPNSWEDEEERWLWQRPHGSSTWTVLLCLVFTVNSIFYILTDIFKPFRFPSFLASFPPFVCKDNAMTPLRMLL